MIRGWSGRVQDLPTTRKDCRFNRCILSLFCQHRFTIKSGFTFREILFAHQSDHRPAQEGDAPLVLMTLMRTTHTHTCTHTSWVMNVDEKRPPTKWCTLAYSLAITETWAGRPCSYNIEPRGVLLPGGRTVQTRSAFRIPVSRITGYHARDTCWRTFSLPLGQLAWVRRRKWCSLTSFLSIRFISQDGWPHDLLLTWPIRSRERSHLITTQPFSFRILDDHPSLIR